MLYTSSLAFARCGNSKPTSVVKSKGFGFANIFKSNDDIFLHIETLKRSGLSDLETGEAIVLTVTEGPRGKMADTILTWDDQILFEEED